MADKKNILILYATAGHGHERAAKAVLDVLKHRGHPRVQALDTLKHTHAHFGPRYRALYFFLIQRAPWLWGFFYGLSDIAWLYFFIRPLRRLTNHFFASDLERLLVSDPPDLVISTHFLGSEVVSRLKKKGRLAAPLLTVITDYAPHTFWVTAETDAYAVATEETATELFRRGVPRAKVFVTGIPIEPKFAESRPRELVARLLGLQPDIFTVLLTSGGAGVGVSEALVQRLLLFEPAVQILVVCGTNHALKSRLTARFGGRSELRLFGFVDNIHELMTASSLMVGKGGGLTVTECLSIGRPMVLIGAVPGQETRNVERMVRYAVAWRARTVRDVVERIAELRHNKDLYLAAVRGIEAIRRPHAAEDVVNAALEL